MSYLQKYAPRFKIKIEGQEQTELQNFILSLEISEQLGSSAKFSITLSDKFDVEKKNFFWLDNPLIDFNKSVEIHMGYPNNLEKMIVGNIKTINTSGFSKDSAPTVTLIGYDPSHTFLTSHPSIPENEDTVEKKGTELIQEIINDYGLEEGRIDSAQEIPIQINEGSQTTNNAILTDLAKRIGFEFFTSKNKIYYINPRSRPPIKTDTFEWTKNLINFNPSLNTADLVPGVIATSSSSTSRNCINGEANSEQVEALESENIINACDFASEKFPDRKEKEIENRNFQSNDEAQAWAISELNRICDKFVTGEGSVLGDPSLQVGQALHLQRMGAKFTGIYFVTKITHKIGPEGFLTNFNLRKNVVGVEI